VPDTIEGIISARMDRLQEDIKRTMQLASVIGRYFPYRVLAASGFLGQRMIIVPEKELVVVRFGYSSKNFGFKNFLKDIISTLPD